MNNRIFGLIGPHGSGKSTLAHRLIDLGVHCIPAYTTETSRQIRNDPYFFKIIDRDSFFKHEYISQVTYKGEYYGILKQDVLDALTHHKVSICLLERNSLKQMQRVLKNKLSTIFFITDFSTLVERLLRLGHTKDEMRYHLEYAQNNGEFDNFQLCDYAFKNSGSVDECVLQLASIMGLTKLLEGEELAEKL
ncbi:hypothetical protein TAMA11512_00110 [Selenomonas sp. TAMA-11512]|uniref:guanylate kinase n=1 Tax=Selenomonas sp. TAMA-11512 TaxID=3095337 RepID=UPI0030891B24|nr:hypothetical protein TAMA11512_00110 [Selenomonas sp. TAMA-11512]